MVSAIALCAPTPQSANAQTTGNTLPVLPATNPSLVELMDQVGSALQSADHTYGQEVAHAKALLVTRMELARHVIVRSEQLKVIDKTCKDLVSGTPIPELGEHHVEKEILAPMRASVPLGPADARAAVRSYQADLELARKRWLDATGPTRQPALRILKEELSRAVRGGNASLADKLRAMVTRLDQADRGQTTTWYREKVAADISGESPRRRMPLAMAIRDVQIIDHSLGQQFTGNFVIRTLVAPYKATPEIPGPGYFLLIYDGDAIVFQAGGGWSGAHDVGSDNPDSWDTHSNQLIAAKGDTFVFTKPGVYTMKLILHNGGEWNDLLDAYETQFTVAATETP